MPFRSSGEREIYNIWVDTICINQDDPEERAQQVLRMGAIYQHATIIMAWLGYPSEAQDLLLLQMACDLITSLAASLDIGLSYPTQQETSMIPNSKCTHVHKDPGLIRSDPKHWNSLRRVFKRSYWNRVWIIQEIAVTKDVLFFWGSHSVRITHLRHAMETCKCLTPSNVEATKLSLTPEFRQIEPVLEFRRLWWGTTSLRLIYALIISRGSESTKPGDKLYALIGLTSDGAKVIPTPNYRSSIDGINRDTALRIILFNAGLDSIIFPVRVYKTWVPQWHNAETWSDVRANNYLCGESRFVSERSHRRRGSSDIVRRWKASMDRLPFAIDRFPGLGIKGKRISRISQCSATINEAAKQDRGPPLPLEVAIEGDWDPNARTLIPLCWLLYDLLPNNTHIKARDVDVKDLHSFLGTNFRRKQVHLEEPKLYKWLTCQKNVAFKVDGRPLIGWLNAKNLSFGSWSNRIATSAFKKRISAIVKMGMRLITTVEGHIGWATAICQPGDEIFLLVGCSVPVVLRPTSTGRYNVIGDSIVHGFMNGQAMREERVEAWPILVVE